MAVTTTLLQFKSGPDVLDNAAARKKLVQGFNELFKEFKFANSFDSEWTPNGFLGLYAHQNGGHIVVKIHPGGLVTIDIQNVSTDREDNRDETTKIENQVKQLLGNNVVSKSLPPISRNSVPTKKSQDYGFCELLYDEDSKYQNVKILRSPLYGNMLLLDGVCNMAESDYSYTRGLTGSGRTSFKDKEVLILGGGDGGVIHEVLKHNPKFVTMLEIDDVVLKAAKKYLRGVCFQCLDSLKGENYEIKVTDCLTSMTEYLESGKTFDCIINDLTDVPVAVNPTDEIWELSSKVFDFSYKLLQPEGKYFCHSASSVSLKVMFSHDINWFENHNSSIKFARDMVFIHSFHDFWYFYEIQKLE